MSRRKRHPNPGSGPLQPPPKGDGEGSLRIPWWAAAAILPVWSIGTGIKLHNAGVRFYSSEWSGALTLLCEAPRLLIGGLGRNLAMAAAFWLLFAGVGRVLVRRLRLGELSRAEELFLSAALGAGALSMILLGLGLAGLWRPRLLQVLFFAGLAACVLEGWRRRNEPQPEARAFERVRYGPWEYGAFALLACAAALNILATAAPEIFYDALVYHLALPKLYLLRGRICPTPENVYSGIPFVVQMLYGPALALGGEGLAALVHCGLGLGTALGLWLWARRFATASTGALAALLFYLCPVSLYASWNSGVDLGASFFSMAALFALSAGLEAGRQESSAAWSAVAGFLAGLAMGTKYNVFPVGAAMVAVHCWLGRRQGRPLRDTLWMALAAGAALAPWFAKNAVFYGNPVYPFLHRALGWTRPADWRGFMDAAGSRPMGVTLGSWAGLKDMLAFPWKVSLSDWPMGDWPGPAFVMLVPWTLAVRWGFKSGHRPSPGEESGHLARAAALGPPPSSWTAAAALAVAAFASWCAASTIFRYLLPGLPFVALVAALAVEAVGLPLWLRRLGWVAALLACAFDFQVAYRQGTIIGQWDFLRGRIDARTYLTRQRVTYGLPYYAAAEYINANLPKDARVLLLGESRAFYLERDFIAATVFDENPFWRAAAEAADAGDLRRRLRDMGVTHILLSARQLLYRKDSPNLFPRDVARRPAFSEFWRRYLQLRFEERGDEHDNPRWLAVYEVLDTPKTDPATFTPEPVKVVLEYLDRVEYLDKVGGS